ncbi:unnamed protein product [Caenorhabditis bovis]|uniref:Uncharacterized protein n=1 Tax=Caenorhabditis bovis TaxID=2654633 RepID=A0A8S1EEG8_9PELO|nr:unnamed protein product [Caenorhabditis bovis]
MSSSESEADDVVVEVPSPRPRRRQFFIRSVSSSDGNPTSISPARKTSEQPVKMASQEHKESVVEKDYSQGVQSDEITIPSVEQIEKPTPDEETVASEPSPPVSIADIESNADSVPENSTTIEEQKPTAEVSAASVSASAKRNSFDSDPGDFEKVEKDEAKNDETVSAAVAGIAANIPIISAQVEEERKHTPSPAPDFTRVTPTIKATVVEESKMVPDDDECGDFAAWLHNNPEMVYVASAVAVASIAGIGYLIYAKKFK